MRASVWQTTALIAGAILSTGCLAHEAGAAAKQAAEQAAPPAITESLQTLNEPGNKKLLGDLMQMPQIRDAARNLGAGLADGALEGLSMDEREARIRGLATRFVQAVAQALSQAIGQDITPALAQGIDHDVTPAVTALAVRSIDAALNEAFAPGHLQQADAFLGSLTRAVVASLAQAIEQAMDQNLGPGLSRMLGNDNFDHSLQKASRALSQGLVLGVDDALTELNRQQAMGRKSSLLGQLAGAVKQGVTFSQIIIIGLGVLVVGLALWIAWLVVQTRRDRAEAARREAAMTLMAEAIHATESKSWSPELKELLRNQFESQDAGPYLQSLLERQRKSGAGKPFH